VSHCCSSTLTFGLTILSDFMCLTGRFTADFLLLTFAIVPPTFPQFIFQHIHPKHHRSYFRSYPPLKGGILTAEKMHLMSCTFFRSFRSLPQFKTATAEA
jgi:hypothetical protein